LRIRDSHPSSDALVVDAINKDAESFYLRYGFSRLAHSSSRLFLPLNRF